MDRPDPSGLFATVMLPFDEGSRIQYKYTRGSWDTVEEDTACGEVDNRTVTVAYGVDGTMTIQDTVLNWRDTGPYGN